MVLVSGAVSPGGDCERVRDDLRSNAVLYSAFASTRGNTDEQTFVGLLDVTEASFAAAISRSRQGSARNPVSVSLSLDTGDLGRTQACVSRGTAVPRMGLPALLVSSPASVVTRPIQPSCWRS